MTSCPLTSVSITLPRYIKNLHTYLLSFAKKTMPLVDIESQQREAAEEFEKKWEDGEIKGWEENAPKVPANGQGSEGIWCGACKYLSSSRCNPLHTFIKAKRTTPSKPFTTPTLPRKNTSRPRPSWQNLAGRVRLPTPTEHTQRQLPPSPLQNSASKPPRASQRSQPPFLPRSPRRSTKPSRTSSGGSL